MELAAHLFAIKNGPIGAEIAAFFDFDGTLISGHSAQVLFGRRLRRREVGMGEAIRALRVKFGDVLSEPQFADFAATAAAAWEGEPAAFLDELADVLYREGIAAALRHQAWRVVKAHLRAGHTVAIATSATRVQVARAAAELGIHHVLCTELEVVDERLTGRLAGPTPWGEDKLAAVAGFAAEHGFRLDQAYAYSNGIEDFPLLAAVGHPHAVNPDAQLAKTARRLNWPVLELSSPPGAFDLLPALRTTGVWGAMAAAGYAGLLMNALSRDRWRGVNLTTTTFAQLGTAVGGIDVDVRGQEHLWAARPAVVLINHQNDLLDLLVSATLMRERTTAVAKLEAKDVPVVGQLFTWAQVAFIDRQDGVNARETMRQAVNRLHEGICVVIAPEGTRSYGPTVGPFKKGAFHLAVEAGVPIVPVVIRNSGELMPRGSRVLRPGTVEVIVQPPISTRGWGKADIDAAAESVRRLYQETLEDWPQRGD
ncbi:MAG: HAD-IB family hydrolase [Austwickia sp.]|nr:HAD-IB family hydrolase [Austwickia sp.]MBK8435205.1 HAD-IB family hydrolase [Austwickia sp.]MBK9101242.1 HAD-IB family hydrolase [Austwickia sp.]